MEYIKTSDKVGDFFIGFLGAIVFWIVGFYSLAEALSFGLVLLFIVIIALFSIIRLYKIRKFISIGIIFNFAAGILLIIVYYMILFVGLGGSLGLSILYS